MTPPKEIQNFRIAIPKDREARYKYIVDAATYLGVGFEIVDIYANNWISKIDSLTANGVVYCPEFRCLAWRQLFNERLSHMARRLNIPLCPSLPELRLYESKREMAYWLLLNKIPHPKTWVFGDAEEALEFIKKANYPIVFKTDSGNAALGVLILRNQTQAMRLFRKSFGNGLCLPFHDMFKVDLVRRAKTLLRPAVRAVRREKLLPRDPELDVMLFQEYVPVKHEWRVIRIGDSYFASEKLVGKNGLHSGSGTSSWNIPEMRVFDFARRVTNAGGFRSMNLDIFETADGTLLVNELQTIFGCVAQNQMYRVHGSSKTPFRYVFNETSGSWVEEEGEFGQDQCYRLRIRDFAEQHMKSSSTRQNL
jgi:hypothetical protein